MVKANYVRTNAGGRAAMRASASYYAHRPDADGERRYRPAFDAERDEIGKEEVYRRAGASEGDYAYRIVASPGREMDAEEIRDWTRDVMERVEQQGGSWAAFVHDDHTEHPHAHVVAFTREKLSREDFAEMREEGDRVAERMVERRAELEHDPMEMERAAYSEREPAADHSAQEQAGGASVSDGRAAETSASEGE